MSNNQQFSTALTKVNDTFFPMIESQLTGNGIRMDDYAKQCVLNSISAINNILTVKGINWNHPDLDKSNVTENLLTIASLKLNPAANPREVYFQLRNVKIKRDGKDVWVKQIEMGIEGDGNDAILSRFGRNIKEVKQFWMVREGDEFEYPYFNGLEMTPPKWRPTGKGEVVRIVYPIEKLDGTVDFHIAERDDVIKNLIAHVKNNLMNETFGIAKDRYSATAKQKEDIDKKKKEIIDKIKEKGLAALDDTVLEQYISPAWKDPQSRESMIIRKMRNNIVKRIPKDFGNAFVQMTYENTDESIQCVRKEIRDNANQEIIDVQIEQPENNENETNHSDENQKDAPVIIDAEPIEESNDEKEFNDNQEEFNLFENETTETNGPGF
ncbi:hypothetical protein M3589_15290 [Heyndrickxia oleronia]|uniref:hypothetical protein n=1 Tax=Heyndrickxia oleronia TaxID=38875 RepID=UPI00203C1BE7|nr:hypothetical protein [Heyndrickxia oleronia]MCM3239087.1 hypothetical protein [Heyndrickxia oleronia]